MNSEKDSSPEHSMTSDGTWALITVTYNSAETLAEYWSSVKWQDGQKWVVVDNNSSDNSVDIARSLGARVIALPKNVGFGKANNIGMHASSSEFVGFVNPDVAPDPSDLSALGKYLRKHDVLLAPQLVFPDGTLQPNGRGDPVLLKKVLHRIAPNFDTGYRIFAGNGEVKRVAWLTGAVVGGRRTTLESLGPWDERFFVYYEDVDLGLRAATMGIPSLLLGDLNWVHGWARATATFSARAWGMELRSLVTFYRRYPKLALAGLAAHRISKECDCLSGTWSALLKQEQ